MQIQFIDTTHKFNKTNLVSKKDGSDDYKCEHCGLTGNRPALTDYVNVKGKKATPACPSAPAPEYPATVVITVYKGNGANDGNLVGGSIHAVVEPPNAEMKEKYPNHQNSVWVNDAGGEPMRLLPTEFEPYSDPETETPTEPGVESETTTAPEPSAPKKKRGKRAANETEPASAPEPIMIDGKNMKADLAQLAWTVNNDAVDANIQATDLSTVKQLQNAEMSIRTLAPDELDRLAFYESEIDKGLKNYVSVGKWLFAIWNDKLFTGEFRSWREYVKTRWNMTGSGAYDLMKAFKTWRLASADKNMSFADAVSPNRWLTNGNPPAATPDAPDTKPAPASDAAAPSQRAVEQLARLVPYLDRAEMSDADFAEFEGLAVQYLYETVGELVEGKLTEKSIREVMDAFLEFAKSRTFEIDGEQVNVSAGEFRITRGVFEKMMSEKQALREYYNDQRTRMSKPTERPQAEYIMTPDPNAADLATPLLQFVRCSHHGDCDIVKIMYGAIQLSCGDVFGFAKDATEIAFNPKLTADNPLEPVIDAEPADDQPA